MRTNRCCKTSGLSRSYLRPFFCSVVWDVFTLTPDRFYELVVPCRRLQHVASLQLKFIRSSVRSCYSWREHPVVSETSMRDSSSFLDPARLSRSRSLYRATDSLPLVASIPTNQHLAYSLSLGSLAPSLFARQRGSRQQVFSRGAEFSGYSQGANSAEIFIEISDFISHVILYCDWRWLWLDV